MARHYWTSAEEAHLQQHYATRLTVDLAAELGIPVSRILAKANSMGLHKTIDLIAETARERTNRPGHGCKATQFLPGMVPHNKGTKGITGHQAGCRATQFRPGNKPHTWVPVGSLRICEGQLQRKVNDDKGPSSLRWHPVSRLVWEAAHGPVPAGSVVVFKPGMKTTDVDLITLDRLELLTRKQLLLQRNGVHAYGPEIARVHYLRGSINRRIKRLSDQAGQAHPIAKDHTHEQ